MSTLQCANIHFESTGNNRLQFLGSNNYGLVAGGVTSMTVNSSVVTFSGGPTFGSFTSSGTITATGIISSSDSVRAPIFYDSNDLNFYVNPNGGSQVAGHFRIGPYAGSSTAGNVTGLEIMNNSGTGDSNLAAVSYHCQGSYGTHQHLRADGYFGIGGWSASAWRWYTYMVNGDMTAAGNVIAYSDPRLKEDITPIDSALDKVLKLNGVKFKWKQNSILGHPGEYDYGILSNEVENIAPEIVADTAHDSPDGDKYKAVAYDKLVPFLIEAIKEQQKQIDELKKMIQEK